MMSDNQNGKTRRPKFGDKVIGIYASENNPLKEGIFVEEKRRIGRMNPGVFYRVTDGRGNFWEYQDKSTKIIQNTSAARRLVECENCELSQAKTQVERQIEAIRAAVKFWREDILLCYEWECNERETILLEYLNDIEKILEEGK